MNTRRHCIDEYLKGVMQLDRKIMKVISRITTWIKKQSWLLLLFWTLFIIPISAGWLSDVAQKWLNGDKLGKWDSWLFWGGAAAILLGGILLVGYGRRLLPPRVISHNTELPRRKVLIAFLSTETGLQMESDGSFINNTVDKDKKPVQLNLPEVLDEVTSAVPYRFSWQQILRAGRAHKPELERIVLIASKGEKGSGADAQIKLAWALFEKYFPNQVTIHGCRQNQIVDSRNFPDFENLRDVTDELNNAIYAIKRNEGYSERDIIIDCTGGTKVVSIAGALATLDREKLQFQYMPTTGEVEKPVAYNVVTQRRYD